MTRSGPTQAELLKDANRVAAHNIDNSIMPYENVDKFSGAGAVVSTGADIARGCACSSTADSSAESASSQRRP
jgi:hypothetical protein